MAIYKTTQGDTFDSIAFKLYGNESYMKDLIEANWRLAETLVFSAGVELTVPEINTTSSQSSVPFWRDESNQTVDTVFEYEEEPIDDEDSEDLTDSESEDEDEDDNEEPDEEEPDEDEPEE